MVKFAAVCLVFLYMPLLALTSSPARAQGAIPTPTPLPRIVATQSAAEARSSAAQAQIQQADADKARADEMRRNGEAQYQQAQADIAAAHEAAATQNAVMVGEAIGRFDSDSRQQRDTNIGQAAIIEAQYATIVSITNRLQVAENEVQFLKTDNVTIQAAYSAAVNRADEAEKSSASSSPIAWIVILAFMGLVAVGLIVVLSRKPSIPQAATVAYDTGDYSGKGDVIDYEAGSQLNNLVSENDSQQAPPQGQ